LDPVRVPIACTLSSEDAVDRSEEWRRFLENSVEHVETVSDHQVRLRLKPSPEMLNATVDLAQREKACCAFFEFSIELQADACWLVVAVPPESAGVLDEVAGHLRHR